MNVNKVTLIQAVVQSVSGKHTDNMAFRTGHSLNHMLSVGAERKRILTQDWMFGILVSKG